MSLIAPWLSAPMGTVLRVANGSTALMLSISTRLSHRASRVESELAMYSASGVERAATDCVLTCQWIGPDLVVLVAWKPKNMHPPTDFRVAILPAQSLSVNPASDSVESLVCEVYSA